MIYFQSISDEVNAKDYLGNRLEKFLRAFPKKHRAALLRDFAKPDPAGVMPHFAPAGELEGAAEAVAATRNIVKELFPLIPGERIEDEELCVLISRPDLEGASLLLRQTTNFAQTFIQVQNTVVMGGRIVAAPEIQPHPQIEEPSVEPEAVVPVWALALAKQLGQKLLEQLGSAVWDVVRKEVLGSTDLPSYYEQVYSEIRQIVASAFQAHYVKEVKDLAAKFDETMTYYNNMGRKETDFLMVKNTSFDLITKSNSLGLPGTFHYAEASVLHIMTLREGYKRLIEEKAKPEDLQKAKNYIRDLAKQFSDNVKAKHALLLLERMATISQEPFPYTGTTTSPIPGRYISGIREGVHDYNEKFLSSCLPVQNMFEDKTNGFWNSMYFHLAHEFIYPKHSWTWVNKNLKRYRQSIYDQTVRDLHPLIEVADRLRALADKPVLDA